MKIRGKSTTRFLTSLFILMIFAATGGLVHAAWADHFPSPEAIGPGAVVAPGPVLKTLTPELEFVPAGSISYLCIFDNIGLFDSERPQMTLAEQASTRRIPLLMARVNSSSLQIPAGLLLPGKSYYWCVESIHAPGSKSEASTSSQKMYFSIASEIVDKVTANPTLSFEGTVRYINLAGGFWGIVSDDGKNYDPVNLAAEFRRNGQRVQLKAVAKDWENVHMWGTLIEIMIIIKK